MFNIILSSKTGGGSGIYPVFSYILFESKSAELDTPVFERLEIDDWVGSTDEDWSGNWILFSEFWVFFKINLKIIF